jgi:hypothetical protein
MSREIRGEVTVRPETEAGRDLQKPFNKILREKGMAAAVSFLQENKDKNPGFVRREAQRLRQRYELVLVKRTEAFSVELKKASVSQLLADLHVEYDNLAEGTRGVFQDFVKGKLMELQGEDEALPSDAQEFQEKVLSGSKDTITLRITEKVRVPVMDVMAPEEEKRLLKSLIYEILGTTGWFDTWFSTGYDQQIEAEAEAKKKIEKIKKQRGMERGTDEVRVTEKKIPVEYNYDIGVEIVSRRIDEILKEFKQAQENLAILAELLSPKAE